MHRYCSRKGGGVGYSAPSLVAYKQFDFSPKNFGGFPATGGKIFWFPVKVSTIRILCVYFKRVWNKQTGQFFSVECSITNFLGLQRWFYCFKLLPMKLLVRISFTREWVGTVPRYYSQGMYEKIFFSHFPIFSFFFVTSSEDLWGALRTRTFFLTVFRIRDVRIRICGSLPLDYESGSCSFLQWLSRCQQKIVFFLCFVLFYFLYRYIYISLLNIKLLRSHKTEVFFNFLVSGRSQYI